jgi:hypothetical protein
MAARFRGRPFPWQIWAAIPDRMPGRSVLTGLAVAAILHGQALVPPPPRRTLETLAQDLARSGHPDEADQIVKLLESLGHERAAVSALQTALTKLLAKPPKSITPGDRLAPQVKRAAAELVAQLRTADDNKVAVANAVLVLDDQSSEARTALGQRQIDGAWTDDAGATLAQRRAEIQAAIGRARRMPIECAVVASDHAVYKDLTGSPGSCVQFGQLRVHSDWPADKLTRVVQTALRALALSRFLSTGTLEAKIEMPKQNLLHLSSIALYEGGVDWAIRQGKLAAAKRAETLRLGGFWLDGTTRLGYRNAEAATEAVLIYVLLENRSRPWLVAGHVNWLCQTMLGEPIPLVTWMEQQGGAQASGTATGREMREREWRLRLAKAGIAGARSWMVYLAERNQDPPLRRCFVDEVGKLQGDELLKVTIASEYLCEQKVFAQAWKSKSADEFAAALQSGLGLAVDSFDSALRAWLVPARRGMAQALARTGRALPPDESAALAKLQELRKQALDTHWWSIGLPPDVRLEESLSAGTLEHARYLRRHPEQAAAWPDAHEEYPDREGFSAAGAWAGSHSVIAPGVKSLSEAIDAWMGTFYHRLPLLEPGLMQCGMAREGDVAVLDAGSMAVPADEMDLAAVWPPPDAKNVPLRFVPELPNPVPGQDQTRLGYPITIQYSELRLKDHVLQLELHDGTSSGAPVDCYRSTPIAPSNPELAPRAAWGLIPKSPLHPNRTYTVTADLGDGRHDWSFRTGLK